MSSLPMVLLVLLLGAFGVLQAALNRQVASTLGLPSAVLLNTLVFLAAASAFVVATRLAGRATSSGAGAIPMRWWWILPGLLGFCVVAGLPFAIQRVGAARVFVALVAAQLVTGLAWDAVVERLPISTARIAGALLVAAGVVVSFRK